MEQPTIVSIGGGSNGAETENRLLDDYLLGLTGVASPRVCFLPTATGDNDAYITRFYSNYGIDRCQPSHLALFNRRVADIEALLLNQDIIYVGGGNTAAMLAVWRQHGVDLALRKAWERGILLCGTSAGAICWFENCSTDSFGPWLSALNDGLAFLGGSACPHYDGEVLRRPLYQQYVAKGELSPGYAMDNYVAIRWTGTELAEVVASKPNARAWRVERTANGVEEREIVPRYLGK